MGRPHLAQVMCFMWYKNLIHHHHHHGSRAVHFDVSLLVSWIQVLTIFDYPRGGEHSWITLILGQMQGLKNCSILCCIIYFLLSMNTSVTCQNTFHQRKTVFDCTKIIM